MPEQLALEKWSGQINVVVIGSGPVGIKIGGSQSLPFLFPEGAIPNKPRVALEIWDIFPADWPQELLDVYGESLKDPFAWARTCVDKYKAQIINIKLQGAHPDSGNKSPSELAAFVAEFCKKAGVPIVVTGCGDDEKDNLVLPACSEALKGQNCLIGCVTQDNYKTIVVSALADGHSIIAESPIDINIAKQLNILISDMGLPLERIVINPTIGALGYGLEYAYSIMERARLAGLSGDKAVASPFICFVGQESWKAKEARADESEFPQWGKQPQRGILWETITATALLQAGADLLVMRHPAAAEKVCRHIDELMAK